MAPNPRALQPETACPIALERLEGRFDPTRPAPRECRPDGIPGSVLSWAGSLGAASVREFGEGASFVRLADDVFLIPVIGGQNLHDDRHLAHLADKAGFSEHCWNLVVEGGAGQMLLVEVGDDIFEHFALTDGNFIYMNTVDRHAISRQRRDDLTVIAQVDGFGPDQGEEALARLLEVVISRPAIQPLQKAA